MVNQKAVIEQYENYTKGGYRNRCHIIGANGLLPLSIPLLKGKNQQTAIKEVNISYAEPWQKIHWQSIQSAYGNAPFYDFYAPELLPHFQNEVSSLFDFNLSIIQTLLSLIGIEEDALHFSSVYEKNPDLIDLRNGISPNPKKQVKDLHFTATPYAQVFLEKHAFISNVSILDLLFCTGPEAISILESCYVE